MPLTDNPFNRSEILPGNWVVLCRLDRAAPDTPGKYALATSSGFQTREDAERYASTVAPSRDPLVACLELP
jgi:hypothetical protein